MSKRQGTLPPGVARAPWQRRRVGRAGTNQPIGVVAVTDPTDAVGPFTREFLDGEVVVEYDPVAGDGMKISARCGGDVLESGEYPVKVFGDRTLRGAFLNSVEESLESREGIDAGAARNELKEWFAEMDRLDRDEEPEKFRPANIQRIVEGTAHPVEIHGGETTTWNVELTYSGRTAELEFTAAEMTGNGGAAALEEKIANNFFEIIDIGPEDWDAIKEKWIENSEVVNVVEETAQDAIADRVLSNLSKSVKPVGDRGEMANDTAAVWFDETNAAPCPDAPPDAAVVWVQDAFLVDQLETAGKTLEYKAQLVKDLIARGDVYGSRKRVMWDWDTRTKVYPFAPDALGVEAGDVAQADQPNHSEVGV